MQIGSLTLEVVIVCAEVIKVGGHINVKIWVSQETHCRNAITNGSNILELQCLQCHTVTALSSTASSITRASAAVSNSVRVPTKPMV